MKGQFVGAGAEAVSEMPISSEDMGDGRDGHGRDELESSWGQILDGLASLTF